MTFQEWLNNTDNLYMLSDKCIRNYMEIVYYDRQQYIRVLEKEIGNLNQQLAIALEEQKTKAPRQTKW